MTWNELKPNFYSEYNGISVSPRKITISKFVRDLVTGQKWEYIRIDYNSQKHQIRFSKSEQFLGHKITKAGTITCLIGKVMPKGRYQAETNDKEIIFTKYDNHTT